MISRIQQILDDHCGAGVYLLEKLPDPPSMYRMLHNGEFTGSTLAVHHTDQSGDRDFAGVKNLFTVSSGSMSGADLMEEYLYSFMVLSIAAMCEVNDMSWAAVDPFLTDLLPKAYGAADGTYCFSVGEYDLSLSIAFDADTFLFILEGQIRDLY